MELWSMFILSVSQIPVAQIDDLTVSILLYNSYTLVKMKGNSHFITKTPGYCNVNFKFSFEKLCLNAPKNLLFARYFFTE